MSFLTLSRVRRRASTLSLVAAALLAAPACSLTPVVADAADIAPMANIALERGRFELDCPTAEVESIGLMRSFAAYQLQSFGVQGCGRRVVYHVECQLRCAAFRDSHVPGPQQESGW